AAQRSGSQLLLWRRRSRLYRLSVSGRAPPCAAATGPGSWRTRGAPCVQRRSFNIPVLLLAGRRRLNSVPRHASRSGITLRRNCEPREKPIVSFGEDKTFASSRVADADVRVSEVCQSDHRRMVSCADSTKPLATVGDSDGQDYGDHDGNSLRSSAVLAVATKMGGPHSIDRVRKPRARDACRGLRPPSA